MSQKKSKAKNGQEKTIKCIFAVILKAILSKGDIRKRCWKSEWDPLNLILVKDFPIKPGWF